MSLKDILKNDLNSKIQSENDRKKSISDTINLTNDLNNKIQNWFLDLKNEGLLNFKLIKKSFNEQGIGTYELDELHLIFANGKEVVVEHFGENKLNFKVYCKNCNGGSSVFISRSKVSGAANDYWLICNPSGSLISFPLDKDLLEVSFERWFK